MDKAITLAELQEIAKTRWIRPRNRDGVNPHMEVPQKGGTLRDEYGRMHFEWRGFLLRVDSAEWSDAENGTYHRITLYGH